MFRLVFAIALLIGPAPIAAQAAPAEEASSTSGLELMIQQTLDRLARGNRSPELTGSGPFPAKMEVDLAFPNATVYRPANLDGLGTRKLGVLIWGNGGCVNDGASARGHLAEIASRGYLVIAPGKPLTGPLPLPGGTKPLPMTTSIVDMRAALDWALAENGRSGSPYYQRIDPRLIATSGHSCGGMLAILLGQDPRIRAVIIHNSGIFPALPDNPPLLMHRERLQGLHTPVLFLLGGKSDVAWNIAQKSFEEVSKVPVLLASIDVGHGGTFDQPHGGVAAKVANDWLDWQLRGDRKAALTFVGKDCKLCVDGAWAVRKKRIP